MPEPKPKIPRKPADERKEDSIRIRVTAEQKEVLIAAAKKEGLGVSSWLLRLGLTNAEGKKA